MQILEAYNIKKYFQDRLILDLEELKIYVGDRIGLIGQNGSGKTTLLNILSGEMVPDEGTVKRFCEITYIHQFSDEKLTADRQISKEFRLPEAINQSHCSGGEKTRLKLANAFSLERYMVFADEPTSNLDYKGIEVLKQKMTAVDSFVLISHDRSLLDSLCNKIIEIDNGRLKQYAGNYSFYEEEVVKDRQSAWQEYEKYVSEKRRLEEAVSERNSRAKSMRKAPRRMGNSEARLHKRAANEKQEKLHTQVNSIKTRLDKLEVKEKPKDLAQIKLDFSLTNPPENRVVISGKDLCFRYGSRRIFEHASFEIYNRTKTCLWGENGAGKTTLLNLIAGGFNESIKIVPKVKVGYFCQAFENLDASKTVLENVMNESVQNRSVAQTILARLLIQGGDVNKKLSVLSGGERNKVSFAKLFVSDANVLLLDEPTNYLDMSAMEALENVLSDYEGTVVFVSHDRAFVNAVAERLLILDNLGITAYDGKLTDYERSRNKTVNSVKQETERMILQVRMAEVVSKLSQPGGNREALEAEYEQLLMDLK